MERPGLLELAVYALVLTMAGGWVYALPPFTHQPGTSQSAEVQPAAAPSSADPASAQVTAVGSQASAAAIEPVVAEPEADGRQRDLLVVTARSLNMRSEPNAASDLVGSYPRGALVEKVETSGNWVLVRTEDEATGWMYTGYLGAAGDN
jgi:uncharacterized protein YgiM (DUF1202 family)